MNCYSAGVCPRSVIEMEKVMRKMPFLAAAILVSAAVGVSDFAKAVEGQNPSAPQNPPPGSNSNKGTTKKPPKGNNSSLQNFLDGWHKAYALVYDNGDYENGIAVLRTLNQDDNADVATLIGYASRKLGRYDDAKYWYEKALAADPDHARTWSYYGMWQAEQGNMLKAKEDLEKVGKICGNTSCYEYVALKEVIDGTKTY
jgi:tetratricopeptide (TPR) repeat protein